jgi:hypothetical protein
VERARRQLEADKAQAAHKAAVWHASERARLEAETRASADLERRRRDALSDLKSNSGEELTGVRMLQAIANGAHKEKLRSFGACLDIVCREFTAGRGRALLRILAETDSGRAWQYSDGRKPETVITMAELLATFEQSAPDAEKTAQDGSGGPNGVKTRKSMAETRSPVTNDL